MASHTSFLTRRICYLFASSSFACKNNLLPALDMPTQSSYDKKVNTQNDSQKSLTADQRQALLATLQTRFEKNRHRHPNLDWASVQARLEASTDKLCSLNEMEVTGGEPDVIAQDQKTGELVFYDCSPETPRGRTNLCYDREARQSRKEHAPQDSAMEKATAMGVELLTEEQYRALQELGEFDTKTSSWLLTPPEIRKLGGAIFGDRRYNHVFVYHNGASSYYGVRGFRASLRV